MKLQKQTLIIILAAVLLISITVFVYLQFFSNASQPPAKVETKAANETYSKSINLTSNVSNVTPVVASPSPTLEVSPTVAALTLTPTMSPSPTVPLNNQSSGTTSAGIVSPTEIVLASPVPSTTKAVTTQLPITGTITTSLIMLSTSLTMIIVAFVF